MVVNEIFICYVDKMVNENTKVHQQAPFSRQSSTTAMIHVFPAR